MFSVILNFFHFLLFAGSLQHNNARFSSNNFQQVFEPTLVVCNESSFRKPDPVEAPFGEYITPNKR